MRLLRCQNYTVEVKKTHIEGSYAYHITPHIAPLSENKKPGYVGVSFKKVRDLNLGILVDEEIRKAGLNPEDIITDIRSFFPNGFIFQENEEQMRHGFGSELLAIISHDSSKYGSRALFSQTHNDTMKNFLVKSGFTCISEGNYYRLL